MKRHIGIAMVLALAVVNGAVAAGYTPPTPAQMAALPSEPAGIAGLIKDASPQQAADVLIAAIAAADASTLTADQKKQLIARLVAYAVVQMGSRAPDMMAVVVRGIPDGWLQTAVAAAIVAAPAHSQAMLKAILDALGAGTDKGKLAALAAKDPHAILMDPLYGIIAMLAPHAGTQAPRMHLMNVPPPKPYPKQ